MTNFKRRLVSTTLAVTMAVTLLPLPATAADTQKDISIGWKANQDQTTMEQVTVDLTASLNNPDITSAEVYIKLSDEEAAALDTSSLDKNVLDLVDELPPKDTPDTPEEPDAGETDENQTSEEGSGEESGNQNQDQGQQPSEPNTDDTQGTETPPESTEDNKEPDSEGTETEGDSSGDSENPSVLTTPEEPIPPETQEPSQDPTESPAAEESAMAAVSASAGEDLSILRESPRGVSAASLTRDGDVGGASGSPAGEPEGTSGYYLSFTLSSKEGEKASIETQLTFKLPEGEETLTIDVTKDDIYLRDVEPVGGDPTYSLDAEKLTLKSAKPEFSLGELTGDSASKEIDQNATTLSDVTFPFTATVPEGSASYTFQLTLPKGVRLPEEPLTVSEDGLSIQAGDSVTVAEVKILADAEITNVTGDSQILSFTLTIGEADAGLVEEVLNALSDGDASVTFSNLQVKFNDLFSAGNNTEIQLTVTQEPTEDGEVTGTVENSSISIQLTAPQGEAAYEQGELTPVTQSVTWLDNNNTEGRRPDYQASEFYPTIHYTIKQDGNEVKTGTLNQSTLAELGFKDWPKIKPTNTGFSLDLPKTLTVSDPYGKTTYTIDWTFQPPEVEGYRLEVGEGEDNTWTYTLTEDFTFTLAMKRGYPGESLSEKEVMALLSQFDFQGQTNVTGGTADSLDLPDFADIVDLTITKGPDDTYTITIPGLAAYGANNAPLVYWVTEKAGSTVADQVTYEELTECKDTLLPEGEGEKGDYYKIAYDNAGVADAGSSTSATYSGGKLTLTLTGVTQYQATKIWLDNGDKGARPDAEFRLWRYPAGTDPSQAAQIRWKDVVEGGDNNFIAIDGEDLIPISEETTEPDTGDEGTTDNDTPATLDGETVTDPSEGGDDATPDEEVTEPEITTQSKFRIEFRDENNDNAPLDLPKYDPDGKRYTYGVREYLTGGTNHYEQVFGEVDPETGEVEEGSDTLPYGGVRANDTLVYNGGTLSNRVTNTATASVTKIWKAAAYQAAFEDVAVEFTLYVRVKPEEGSETNVDADWKKYQEDGKDVTCVLHDFSAESMTDSASLGGLDLYDGNGQELEYRWVETAVYQGVEGGKIEGATPVAKADEEAGVTGLTEFTLTQTATDKTSKDVVYQSETKYEGNNRTTVTNSVEDTVDFALAKEWKDITEEDRFDVTFHIYQALAGNDFNFDTPYVSVTIPKDESKDPYLVGEDGNSIPSISPAEGVTITLTSDVENINNFNTQNPNRVPDDYEDWDAIVQNLPLYDETGHLYNYFVLEAAGSFSPSYDRGYYPTTGDYSCVITNGPGDEVVLMVQKNWIDDGDALHREPVTVGVYYADEETEKLEPLTKEDGSTFTHTIDNSKGSWTDFIYIPDDVLNEKDLEAKDLYIVEQTVGEDAKVTHGNTEDYIPNSTEWEKGYIGAENDNNIFQVSTDNHRYQVTYEKKLRSENDPAVPANVAALYVVTNRRLGTVDMTVNKTWVSGGQDEGENDGLKILTEALNKVNEGEGPDLALAFQLQFASETGWEITTNGGTHGDTVSVGGEAVPILGADRVAPAASIQVILGPENTNNTNFSFHNLPKYDEQGAVVAYTVEEVWVSGSDGNWKVLDNGLDDSSIESLDGLENLQTIWSEYRAAITSQNYTVGSHDVNPGGNAPADDITDAVQTILNTNPAVTRRDQDKQTITYTNTRTQTKEVKWYKVWRDNFADQQGNRPDLYLDIYRVVHEDGQKKIELVKKDYRWQVVQQETTETETLINDSSADVTTGTNAANDVWSVTLHGVEKYDREGYEIQYFAVERTAVRVSDFDYQAAQYAYSSEGHATDIIGDRDGNATDGSAFGDYTLDLDVENWAEGSQKPDNIGEFQGSGSQGIAYPQYALLENGTFINTLANSFPVTGMKRWESLPSGYLSNDPDLPTVTFEVYRSTDADNIPTDGDPVASLTIQSGDWKSMAKSGSSYSFRIDYEGANVVSVNDGEVRFVPANTDGTAMTPGEDGSYSRAKLPLYDENGNRYYYKATEAITYNSVDTQEETEGGEVQQEDHVYHVTHQDMAGNFTFVNTYAPDVGGLKVKKILSLPADTTAENGGFPSVSFTLKRTYTLSNKEQSKEETVSTLTWTSEQVQEAFAEAKGDATDSTPVLLENDELVWNNLPIYAPNGSKYVYSIQENTGNLGGYLTYAKTGNLNVSAFQGAETSTEIGNLAPEKVTPEGDETTATELAVQATFYNVWEDNQETVTLSGTKAWQDYGDAMDTRPTLPNGEVTSATNDPLGLVVKRTANGSKETLELGEDYTVTYAEGENDTWTFEIKGIGNGELEKYATQGVAWTYTVTETTTGNEALKGYTGSGAWSAKADKTPGDDGSIALGSLTNSLYTNVSFNKKWVDESDTPITSDYIDFPVTVTFQLQVKAGDGDWQNAGDYFDQALGDKAGTIDNTVTVNGWEEGADYTASKTGKVHNQNWSGSFQNLPRVIRVGGELVALDYRVVETAVAYNGTTQTIELNGDSYTVTDSGLVTGATLNGNTTTNTLSAISVTVAKEWVDNENQYDTRPNSQGGNMTWESWFVLQRKTENGETWDNVKLVNLYGTNRNNSEGSTGTGEKWSETISGLPTMDFTSENGGKYTYRFQELKPKQVDGKVVGYADTDLNDDLSDYLVGNGETYFEAGNEDSFDYEATYSKEDGIVSNGETVTVTNSLLTRADTVTVEKVWYNENGDPAAPENASVTVELQQQIAGSAQWTAYQTVTLPYNDSWSYTWENLPMLKDGKEVTYQVVEKAFSPDTYINIHNDMSTDEDATAVTYTFTNVAPTEFTIEKKWVGMDDPTGEITVGLYRTTEEDNIGSTEGAPVPINETDNASPRTATLNADNKWTTEFTGLPKYNKDGAPYHYYALEMSGGKPVAQQGSLNHDGQDYAVDYDHANGTTIRNIPTTAITGTKTWVDNGNAYDTRPDAGDFQLTLWRTTDGEIWAEISDLAAAGITFTWDTGEEGSNTWTYHFDNLPQYTPEGAAYSYRVTEPDLNAYNGTSDGKEVTSADEGMTGPSFTNTLTGFVTVEGTKTWDDNDNADGTRPNSENFQLTLERTTDEKTWEPVSNATLTWTSTEGNAWTYTFGGNLPLYDGNGVRYTYRVTEADQDAYDVYYTNGSSNVVRQENLRNVARGELTVTKTVTGNRGSWSQDFDFSVTFTLPEDFDQAVNGEPSISYTKSDGTSGRIDFEAGQTTLTYDFQLRHGQSITFTDLPGGTSYDVDETNSYGHSQSFTGDVGAIPAGEAVTAAFVNHRSGGSWEPDDPTPEDPEDPTPEDPDDPTPEDPDDPTPEDPEDPTPEDPDDPTPEDPEDPEDPDEPDDPGIDIPEDPTPGVDVPTDPDDPTPEDPDDPDDPEDPGIDIPDDPSPGTDIPDDPTPGTDTPTKPSIPDKDTPNKLPQTGQLWWPVGLLMAAGAALLAAGVLRIRKHHGRDAQK